MKRTNSLVEATVAIEFLNVAAMGGVAGIYQKKPDLSAISAFLSLSTLLKGVTLRDSVHYADRGSSGFAILVLRFVPKLQLWERQAAGSQAGAWEPDSRRELGNPILGWSLGTRL
jgi:hypothetical protein